MANQERGLLVKTVTLSHTGETVEVEDGEALDLQRLGFIVTGKKGK